MKPTGQSTLGVLVDGFMRAMHPYDAGRTLPILHAAKLTTPQIAVLEFTREPQTVSAVATYLGLSRPATSQLTDKLVREHLVRRMEGTMDRRERIVVLSAKGKSLIDRIAAARAARFESALAVLPTPVAARFHSILNEVIGALAEADKPGRGAQFHRSGIR
jgi:DNA-binding MarR family transcriptional regulator